MGTNLKMLQTSNATLLAQLRNISADAAMALSKFENSYIHRIQHAYVDMRMYLLIELQQIFNFIQIFLRIHAFGFDLLSFGICLYVIYVMYDENYHVCCILVSSKSTV